MNPVGALGPFIAMTMDDAPEKRRNIALRAAIVSGAILAGCAAVGAFIFKFYGITIPALKIAGGVLLFFVGFDMINARPSRTKQTEEEQSEGVLKPDVAVFPLGIPLLSGPGSIVSVFMLADKANTFERHAAIYLAIVLVSVISWLSLREAHRIVKLMGQIGINVMSRLMGVMLAAIAVQFIIDGLRAAFPSH
ncbi:MAG: MarC family protein [Bdellovibrionaceae bacterium]|nr:MarC family protein [Pseudobdellovibrionaceae bacterium]